MEGNSVSLNQRIKDIHLSSDRESWWSAASRMEFTEVANERSDAGNPDDQIVRWMRRLYSAAVRDEIEGQDDS